MTKARMLITVRSMLPNRAWTKRHEDNVLAAIAGYVDTFSFVALFGLFTAHVTGNFVLIGVDVAGYGQGIFTKLMTFPAFVSGIVLSSAVVKAMRSQDANRRAASLYAIQAALLVAFCVSGVGIEPALGADSVPIIVCGMLGAAAMGVQNAHSRLIDRVSVPNTVMTGNVTQAVLDVVNLASSETPVDTKMAVRIRLGKLLRAISCFGSGAVVGALAYRYVSFWALMLPVALLVTLALSLFLNAPGAQDRAAMPGPNP